MRFSFAGNAAASPSTGAPVSSTMVSRGANTTKEGNALLVTVIIEVAVIVGLRHIFRKHHGG
jgi:hypothetical protein